MGRVGVLAEKNIFSVGINLPLNVFYRCTRAMERYASFLPRASLRDLDGRPFD